MQSKLESLIEITVGTCITICITIALELVIQHAIILVGTSLVLSTAAKYIIRRIFNLKGGDKK